MAFVDDVKLLVAQGEIQEASTDFLSDVVDAVLGSPVAVGKIIKTLVQSPFFLKDQLFWAKIELFLNGVILSENDRGKLSAKLTEDGSNSENARRLVDCIDRADTNRKIRYLINATRCLLTDFIDRTTYFRICRAVTNTLDEDLLFLRNHISEKDLIYNDSVQGLYTSGLMYWSAVGEDPRYSFTSIARLVDRYALSYDDVERYPNPMSDLPLTQSPNIALQIPTIPSEDLKKILDNPRAGIPPIM